MVKAYKISGMTCGHCVAKVQKALEKVEGVQEAAIQLAVPQGKLTLQKAVATDTLQQAIGPYQIVELPLPSMEDTTDLPDKTLATYKPLLLTVGFIIGVSLLVQYPFDTFSGMLWMRHFMAGFFLVFAFFKLLNLEGFANSYRHYDIIAKRWIGWGYLYPFVELALGIGFSLNIAPRTSNILTIIVLGISSIGVIQSNWKQQKIKCACLGDVFQLPMSTVTIVEDLSMVLMAGLMLLLA